MLKYTKSLSVLLLLASVFLGYLIWHSAEKVVLSEPVKLDNGENAQKAPPLLAADNQKEGKYLADIKKMMVKTDVFVGKLDKEYSRVNIGSRQQDAKKEIGDIMSGLNEITVPTKYKEFHLLFSRSLLRLSTYFDTLDQKEKEGGLDLYKQVKAGFSALES